MVEYDRWVRDIQSLPISGDVKAKLIWEGFRWDYIYFWVGAKHELRPYYVSMQVPIEHFCDAVKLHMHNLRRHYDDDNCFEVEVRGPEEYSAPVPTQIGPIVDTWSTIRQAKEETHGVEGTPLQAAVSNRPIGPL